MYLHQDREGEPRANGLGDDGPFDAFKDKAPVLHVIRRPSSPERRGRRHLSILGPVAQVLEYGSPRLEGLTLSIVKEVLERGGPQCSRQRKAQLPKSLPHPGIVDVEAVLHFHHIVHLLS